MKLGEKYRELKAKQRTLKMMKQISHKNVVDALAQFLYSNSLINDDQEIKNIELLPTTTGVHEMEITYVKVKKEVYKTKANGKAGS